MTKKIVFDEQATRSIINLYQEGVGLKEIGQSFGCSVNPIWKLLRANNAVLRILPPKQYSKECPKEMTCHVCGETKLLELFRKHNQSPYGHHSICRQCAWEREGERTGKLRGLPVGYFAEHYPTDGLCEVCDQEETVFFYGVRHRLSLDHNHRTDKPRGFICRRCNTMLGYCQDSIEILEKAIQYLNHYDQEKEE